MNCPKCHRNTYSKKWETCTAQDCASNELRNQTPTVTKPTDEIVTNTVRLSPGEMERLIKDGRVTHGGARAGSGRKRQFETNAERQRAYRSRK